MTALTPLMARVLHACGAAVRPEGVAVLGSYAGNLMMWLTAAGFGPFRQYAGQLAVGVDVDEEAVLLARANFSMAGYQNMQFRTNDAFSTAGSLMVGAVDALLIDIDDPVERKGGYLSLLQTWLPYLSPGALVIAHDVVHPRFAESLKGYLDFVSGPPFVASTTLPVDECGVAVSALGTSA
ncbi:O-methyltransferase [Streptomyces celluloflavus]|uniref:O-methyltransferase n=1 Tax=Streptomyces celluloflavus TaxID=58344 RepID=A0ABW7RKV9_9ACTN